MKRAIFWLAPIALIPVGLLGLQLWHGQGALIWLADAFAACF
jgi:hypothetical protein